MKNVGKYKKRFNAESTENAEIAEKDYLKAVFMAFDLMKLSIF